MSTPSYLIHILYGQLTAMNSDLILVIIPIVSISVLIFGLRSILLDTTKTKFKKQV